MIAMRSEHAAQTTGDVTGIPGADAMETPIVATKVGVQTNPANDG